MCVNRGKVNIMRFVGDGRTNRMEIVIRDEAKIAHEIERTKRWKMWLPYSLGLAVLSVAMRALG